MHSGRTASTGTTRCTSGHRTPPPSSRRLVSGTGAGSYSSPAWSHSYERPDAAAPVGKRSGSCLSLFSHSSGCPCSTNSIRKTLLPWDFRSAALHVPAGVNGCGPGVLVGLAVTSQQFALLVLAPLVVVAPGKQRWRLLGSSAAVVALVSLPFVVATSGRAVHAVLFGTGDSMTFGGTLLWESGLRGSALVFCSRILPILVSMAIALWALRRLGSRVLEPIPLISLVATTLSLRLVFEEGLFGYKFLALGVMLAPPRHRSWADPTPVSWRGSPWRALAFNPIPGPASHQRTVMGRSCRLGPPLGLDRGGLGSHRVQRRAPTGPLVSRRLVRRRRLRFPAMATVATRLGPRRGATLVLATRALTHGSGDGGQPARQFGADRWAEAVRGS